MGMGTKPRNTTKIPSGHLEVVRVISKGSYHEVTVDNQGKW